MTGERAVSPVVGYVLTLGISTLLMSGLLIAAGGFVDTQREQTTESELQVIGQQVSADIAAADRLHRTDGATDVVIERDLPDSVVGSQYTVFVRSDNDGPTDAYLRLRTVRPEVTVEVGVANETNVAESAAGGGKIEIRITGAGNLEVTNG
jgi:type II secretory pathway pseudopilin PulG